MNQINRANKELREYIFFSNVSPSLKNPFFISFIVHFLLFLTGLSVQESKMHNEFRIEIINTPTDMNIDQFNRLSSEQDQSIKSRDVQVTKDETGADIRSAAKNKTGLNKSSLGHPDESFVNKYEDILFNKKNSGRTEKKTAIENPDRIKWDDENRDVSHSSKEQNSETEKIPMGRGESRNIKWSKGYTRKLIFQPEIDYPAYFRKQGIQASVRLLIDVDVMGNVTNAEILESSGYSKLDILARAGALKAKFLKRENQNNTFDRGEVEVLFKLER